MGKIYTRTGDKGETGLIGGARIAKDHARIAALGDVDEVNAALGLARALLAAHKPSAPLSQELESIQADLFELGAELAADPGKPPAPRIKDAAAKALEKSIDRMTAELPRLKSFILPGGSPAGAALHLARAVCRRAERSAIALAKVSPVRPELLVYLNRLSDFLFTLARLANLRAGNPETPWLPL